MKRIKSIIYITIFFLVIYSLYSEEKNQVKEPDIQFIEKEYYFGIAGQNETIQHAFHFENKGTDDLIIKRIDVSCGCLATTSIKEGVQPGQKGEITVKFETAERKGFQEKKVYVYSNDPDEPEITLHLSGEIRIKYAINPQTINFGDIVQGTEARTTLEFTQFGEENIIIRYIKVYQNYFSTKIFPIKNGYKIEIEISTDAPAGQFNEVITLYTNMPDQPKIDVLVWGNVLGRICIHPHIVSFGRIKKGSVFDTLISINSADGQVFKIVKIMTDPPYLESRFVFIEENPETKKNSEEIIEINQNEFAELNENYYYMQLGINSKAPLGMFEGTVSLYTDEPKQESIVLPVYGVIID